MGSIANELITHGWVQRHTRDEQGRVCLRWAARIAYDCTDSLMPQRVNDALRAVAGGEICPGLAFNDTPGRTFDEVLRVAKEADEILGAS